MVNFTVDQVRNLMGNKDNIRNISVIAHVDHGKSTLTDSLVSKAGIIAKSKAGEARFTDTRKDEQERSITIKSTSISMFYEYEKESDDDEDASDKNESSTKKKDEKKGKYLINLIDSPGHVDFSSEVTAALRVTDGALVVVDCINGVCIQTETVLRQAVNERIRPILFLNKMDRVFMETQKDLEDSYDDFRKIIESVNAIISTYKDVDTDLHVDPCLGNVGFGSGAYAWGFTVEQFAKIYAKKTKKPKKYYMQRLWGDYFYNPKTKRWAKKKLTDDHKRGFCYFIMRPISRFINSAVLGKQSEVDKFVRNMKIDLPEEASGLIGKELMKCVMRNWIPAGDALLSMIVEHIPSPAEAQKYRYENLYTGDLKDKYSKAIQCCNQDGPLVLYISKMIPANERGKFYAFGRVFAGKVYSGQKVRIMGSNYNRVSKTDQYKKNIQRTVVMMGRFVEQIVDVPAGNVVGIVGVDDVILKSATIVGAEDVEAEPIKSMKFSVSPVVSVAVETKSAQDLPKLVEGLKKLSKSDPLVSISRNSNGQHIIACAGELHLEICVKDLGDFMKGSEIIKSDPIVTFCETITANSDRTCIAKSPNKHNRIQMQAQPMGLELCGDIEDKTINEYEDVKVRAAKLVKDYNWDATDARKIWSFGCPPDATANLLVDATKGIQYLNEIKDSVKSAFTKATLGGILCQERMRGCCFKLIDVTLHADAIHRGAGQIMPASRRAFCACQIISGPAMLEPVYRVEISVPSSAISGVYNVLNKNRGVIEEEKRSNTTPMMKVSASLPVMESLNFASRLRQATGGQAFAQMNFSHWQPLSGELYDEESKAHEVCMEIRKRKGMKPSLPDFNDYYDKI